MFEIVNRNIRGKKYIKLIYLMLDYCDKMVFQLPNTFKHFDEEKINADDTIESVNFVALENNDLFCRYKNKVKFAVKMSGVAKNIINEYESLTYYGKKCNHTFDVFVMSVGSNLRDYLFLTDSIYDWKYPDLPEDICFFKNNKCVLETITHEKLTFLHTDDKELLRKIKFARLRLKKSYSTETLTLSPDNKIIEILEF